VHRQLCIAFYALKAYNSTTNDRSSLKLSPFDSAYTITPLYFLSAYSIDFCLKLLSRVKQTLVYFTNNTLSAKLSAMGRFGKASIG
jgi:hypothetical protein